MQSPTDLHPLPGAAFDLDTALDVFGEREFRSPFRSTVPLLALLKDGGLLRDALLGAVAPWPDQSWHLEYQVTPPRGKGKASHTDLMIRSDRARAAVEAKWTEPRYDSVEKWIEAGSNGDNRKRVLDGWLSLIEPHTNGLNAYGVQKVVYQMLHRAASACFEVETPRLVYVEFQPQPNGHARESSIRKDLSYFWNALGQPASFPFYHVTVRAKPTKAFDALRPLKLGDEETSKEVVKALFGPPLFSFENFTVHPIQ